MSQRTSLYYALECLVISWWNATPIDDEVVDFTDKDGWLKVDKLVPLLPALWAMGWFGNWVKSLHQFTDEFKVSNLLSLRCAN